MRLAALMTMLLLAMAPAYGFKDSGSKDGGFKGQGFKSTAACPEGAQGVRCHAEQGQANSQYEWGMMLLDGDGVERDHMQALKWLSRAAKQGHGTAGYILSRLSLSSEPGGVCGG